MQFLTGMTYSKGDAKRAAKNLLEEGFPSAVLSAGQQIDLSFFGPDEGAERAVQGYLDDLPEGSYLVATFCGDRAREEALRLLHSQEGLEDPARVFAEMRGEGREERGAMRGAGWRRGKVQEKREERVEREGAKKHAVHVETREELPHQEERAMEGGRHTSSTFEDLEGEFERHYRDVLAPKTGNYRDLMLAYRLGVQLGENEMYEGQEWEDIAAQVKESWEERGATKWGLAKEAVRFGFVKARWFQSFEGEERKENRG